MIISGADPGAGMGRNTNRLSCRAGLLVAAFLMHGLFLL